MNVPTRREEILALATQLFSKQGVQGTSMRDLANAAGILPSSLYSHFASKEALADEILREYLEDFLRQCQEVEAATTAPIDRLRGLIRVSLAGADAFPAALVIFHRDLDYLASLPRFAYLFDLYLTVRNIRANRSVNPARICPTSRLTGGWRCDVPINCRPPATIASICSGRTFEGPHPNRPSPGSSSAGMTMALGSTLSACQLASDSELSASFGPWLHLGQTVCKELLGPAAEGFWHDWSREPNLPPTCRDRSLSHPRRRFQGEGTAGCGRERDRVRSR